MKKFIKERIDKYYKDNFWHLIADVMLGLIIISLIIFLILSKNVSKNKDVSLEIKNESKNIIVGQLESFDLIYKANDDLKNASVSMVIPRNFIIDSVLPADIYNKEKNTFSLGDVKDGTHSKLRINGYVVGEKNDHQMISFTFNCDNCGKNGVLSSYFYQLSKYFLDVDVLLPEKIYNNSDFEGKISLKNNSSRDLEDITIDLGSDMGILDSSSGMKENKIYLESIKAKEGSEIVFNGSINNFNKLEINPKTSFSFIDRSYLLTSGKVERAVEEPELKLNLSSGDVIVNSDSYVDYKLTYSNQSLLAIKNLDISILSANPNFLIEDIKFSTKANNISIDDGRIIKIEDLIADESGEINLSIKFDRKELTSNQEVYLKMAVKYEVKGENIFLTSYSNKNKIKSELSVLASARYYSPQGDQLGVGPLPPAVEIATNYWLFLEFNNAGNNLKNFILTAELPDNVYFSGNKRVLDGNLDYAEIGKRIIWEVSETEGDTNKYRANLEIILIPEKEDLGNIVDLVKNIKFTVYDDFIKEDISGNIDNINTNLKDDKFSSGKGKVVIMR